MKLLKVATLLFCVMTLTTGCYNQSDDSLENLLDDLPIYNNENYELYDAVKNSLSGFTLLLPQNSTDVGKINTVDLNGDGKENTIFFQYKESVGDEEENQVGFTILDKNYKTEVTHTENGNSISYADFYDLDNDGNKEIVLLIENNDITNLYIYSWVNGSLNSVSTKDIKWPFDSSKTKNMKVMISNLDKDKKLEILIMKYDLISKKMYMSLVDFNSNNLDIINYLVFDNVANINDLYIKSGYISSSQLGAIIQIPYVENNGFMIQMIYLNENKLYKVFDEEKDKNIIYNSYYIPVEDMNNDKILDLPRLESNMTDEINSSPKKNSSIISWCKWNGKTDENSNLVFIIQVYYNYQYNFKFLIPNNLVDKVYFKQEFSGDVQTFKFCYYDYTSQEPKELFTVNISPKTIVEDSQSITTKANTSLIESEQYLYSISINNEEELAKFDLNADIIKDYFSLIYE